MPSLEELTDACARHLPSVLRWGGAVATQLRQHNVSVSGKTSGSSNTDALTLADLSVQELIVAALRDCDPVFQQCRLEAEEGTGDIDRFAADAPYTIAIDPIDGTKMYRDRSGDGWAVIVMLRSVETVHYSLVYIPETGDQGTLGRSQRRSHRLRSRRLEPARLPRSCSLSRRSPPGTGRLQRTST